MTSDNDPWAGILDPDEKILWQGRPAPGIRKEWSSATAPFFYLFFTGFSLFWMLMASAAGGYFWTFGLLFFGVGAYNLVGIHFWKARNRRNTFYTLTNKRAFIATAAKGARKLDSYPILPHTTLQFVDGRFGDIWFDGKETPTNNQTRQSKIGFERLENGRDVFAMFRQIQRGVDGSDSHS